MFCVMCVIFFFFKQKTAYEMRISDWSSDVCSSDLVPQGISAEMIAEKWGISREDMDAFGAESQRRAEQATAEGRFENEIVGVTEKRLDKETGNIVESDELVLKDEGIRPGTTVETLANLKPAFKPDGSVTAGNSSQISDGASAMLIMSEEKAKQLGLTPRARFHKHGRASRRERVCQYVEISVVAEQLHKHKYNNYIQHK